MAEEKRRKGTLLGVIAYVLVPGERRVCGAGKLRKKGFEKIKGVVCVLPGTFAKRASRR
jgi:hypothetical protein